MALQLRRHRHRHRLSYSTPPVLAALLIFLSSSAAPLPQYYGSSRQAAATQEATDDRTSRMKLAAGGRGFDSVDQLRQGPREIGSSPPTCQSKCGQCSPCQPVHVPFHPGIGLPLEYYPEAWRCKCGSKLFMP
ncbi:hypothetical protein SAY87_018974 [Trapa incisa]|uniref:Epidermal patterning factor-like protein n=2 Tax=Trapa TaxID=22665 RepID=A0AAN7M8Z4_TRANT|nr:hypothetical protein SAY87_018974 [Trapa incisa]KAK4791935.1 hypothetical protein SAY86_022370 [Trapa natans]